MVLVTGAAQPYADLRAMLDYARRNPGRVGTGSTESLSSFIGQELARRANVEMADVQYRSGGQLMNDIVAGHLPVGWTSTASAMPHMQTGRVRVLAVSTATRTPFFPDVPTAQEQGVADFDLAGWVGLYGPAGLPDAVVQRLQEALTPRLRRSDAAAALHRHGDRARPPPRRRPAAGGAAGGPALGRGRRRGTHQERAVGTRHMADPRLKAAFAARRFVVAPGIFDMISAKVADGMGFDCLYVTGFGTVASHLGVADAGIATYTDMVGRVGTMARGCRTPVIADADTGYGGLLNVRHTVMGYEAAGVSGIQLEDQEMPKKCGHTPGRRVIPAEEMALKIRVAVEARQRPELPDRRPHRCAHHARPG